VLLGSSGIHANGLSLARKLAERLPRGYLTEIEPGLTYGDALLAPTTLYSPVTEALWAAGVGVHYAANIHGHGWRKLLRHPKALKYRIHTVPPVPPVLRFMAQHAGHDDAEAYGTLNMGAGFALFVAWRRGRTNGAGCPAVRRASLAGGNGRSERRHQPGARS
jgi:phosphoribosylformylglycinamidine cyclo-ligase